MKLGIIILYVRDMAKAKKFYTETVGLTIDPEQSGPVFTALRFDNGFMLALEDVSILPPGQAKEAGSVEIGIEVDNVDSLWTQWKAKGVEMVTDPADAPFGRNFLAKDPDGHYLTVYRLAQRAAQPK